MDGQAVAVTCTVGNWGDAGGGQEDRYRGVRGLCIQCIWGVDLGWGMMEKPRGDPRILCMAGRRDGEPGDGAEAGRGP